MTEENSALEPLRGSTLDQMWLDGEKGKLHPAESKLLEACRRGEKCVVGDMQNGKTARPSHATKDNVIRAGFLRYLILGGCQNGPVHARGVQLYGAFIKCDIGINNVPELDLESATIPHDIFLINCFVGGTVNIRGATALTLGFDSSHVEDLQGDGLQTKGSINLRFGFTAKGIVRLLGADIGGQLCCRGGKFNRQLNCQEARITDSVILDGKFQAKGRVSFVNSRIGGNIDCSNGHFLEKDNSFFANRAVIDGDVEFNNTVAAGSILMTGSIIKGNLSFVGVSIEGVPSVQLRGTKIEGMLRWHQIKYSVGELDLSGASCTTINVGQTSWFRKREKLARPELASLKNDNGTDSPGKKPKRKRHELPRVTRIDNFTYRGFSNLPEGTNAKFWKRWLAQQPDDHLGKKFRPKPWSQLADVLESMGHEAEAKAVRIERERMLTEFLSKHDPETSTAKWWHLSGLRLIWRRIWGITIDYGYQPLKALGYLAGVIVVGAFIFYWATTKGIMAPTHPLVFKEARLKVDGSPGTIDKICAENWVRFKDGKCKAQMPSEYSEFSSLIYSADVALPIINLRQQDDWSPRVVDHEGNTILSGHIVRIWEWLVTVIGWVLSLMFAAAVGGFVRR